MEDPRRICKMNMLPILENFKMKDLLEQEIELLKVKLEEK